MTETDAKQSQRWRGLLLRVVSALVLLPVVLGAIWGGHPWFTLLLFVAAGLMAFEWFGIIGIGKPFRPALVTAFLVPGFGLLAVDLFGGLQDWVVAIGILSALTILFGLLGKRTTAMYGGIGLAYIWLPLYAFFWLREIAPPIAIFWIFAAVWLMDIGGYFVGKKIGGAKLAPRISPNKTWSGLMGGVALSGIGCGLIAYLAGFEAYSHAIAGAILAVVAQIGDLFESAVKRRFEVKDSGQIIPGHGGILDRIDGLLFAGPAVALALLIAEF